VRVWICLLAVATVMAGDDFPISSSYYDSRQDEDPSWMYLAATAMGGDDDPATQWNDEVSGSVDEDPLWDPRANDPDGALIARRNAQICAQSGMSPEDLMRERAAAERAHHARYVPYDAPRPRNPVAHLIQSQATEDRRSAAKAAGGEAMKLFERWVADCNSVSDYALEQQYDEAPSDHSSDISWDGQPESGDFDYYEESQEALTVEERRECFQEQLWYDYTDVPYMRYQQHHSLQRLWQVEAQRRAEAAAQRTTAPRLQQSQIPCPGRCRGGRGGRGRAQARGRGADERSRRGERREQHEDDGRDPLRGSRPREGGRELPPFQATTLPRCRLVRPILPLAAFERLDICSHDENLLPLPTPPPPPPPPARRRQRRRQRRGEASSTPP
jgi:hypothetical protein